jgi:predicted Zn-dependent protease
MFSQQDVKNIIDRVIGFSKLPECEVNIQWTEDDFIRFANNGITTSGYRITQQISITSTTADKRSGNATVSEITPEALKNGVKLAEELAAISRPNPEAMPALPAQKYPQLSNFDAYTASARGDVMIPHVKAVVAGALKNNLIAAGFIQRSANAVGVGNKAGLFGYHTFTDSSLTHTIRSRAGTSSGWATQSSVSLKDLNGEAQARVSIEKCVRGVNRKMLDPGKYTVIMEPAATADLIGWLGFAFGAREAEQGQSFLSKAGLSKAGLSKAGLSKAGPGNPDKVASSSQTYLGEKLFPAIITLRSDPFHPKLASTPWGPSLLPNEKTAWIDKGVVANLYYDRYWAEKAGRKPTPYPVNLVLDGQQNTLADLIKSVDRGLLVTRLWYIRVVQPKTWQLTGLTRDGVFLIENGKVTDPVTNFRWNESPAEVLQRTTKLTEPVRITNDETGANMAPALITTDFNFTSVSDAV